MKYVVPDDLWITGVGELFIGRRLRVSDVRKLEPTDYERFTESERAEIERWLEAYAAIRESEPVMAVIEIRKNKRNKRGTLTVSQHFISLLTGKRERGEVSKKRLDMEMLGFLGALVEELHAQGFGRAFSGYGGDAYYHVTVPVNGAEAAADAAATMLEFSRVHEP